MADNNSMETNPIIDKLFSIGAHFGMVSARRHPSTSGYLFGAKGGIELFDLEQTAALLAEALDAVKALAAERKTILFVGGQAPAREAVERAALRLNAPYCAGRWIGGTLTNFSEIKKRLARLEEIADSGKSGELMKFTKRERSLIDHEMSNLTVMFGGLRGMSKLPDALFVVDPKHESGAVAEARQLNIPIIALLNSDCDRTQITHPIPGNDASRETIHYVLSEVATAYLDAVPPAVAASAIAA